MYKYKDTSNLLVLGQRKLEVLMQKGISIQKELNGYSVDYLEVLFALLTAKNNGGCFPKQRRVFPKTMAVVFSFSPFTPNGI
jgi:hypothetical protein